MKLAEALNARADLKTRIAQLSQRLKDNAKVQEGERPAEEPDALLRELEADLEEMRALICRINRTNCETMDQGESLSDLLARRDTLSLQASIMREFLQEASQRIDRYSNKEIRILSTVDVSALRRETDKLSRELRELDSRIQGLNWNTELL